METFKNMGAAMTAAKNGNADAMYIVGLDYLNHKRTREAYDYFKRAAKKGNTLACVELGRLMLSSFGHHDVTTAESWFKDAANSKDADTLCKLGTIYLEGDGVEFNMDLAEKYLEEAKSLGSVEASECLSFFRKHEGELRNAAIGNTDAQYKIGHIYLDDNNTKSTNIGLRWLDRAAGKGCTKAVYELGAMYQDGNVVHRDLNKAKGYLEMACQNNFPGATERLNKITNMCQLYSMGNSYCFIYDRTLYYNSPCSGEEAIGNGAELPISQIKEMRYTNENNIITLITTQPGLTLNIYNTINKNDPEGKDVLSTICEITNFHLIKEEKEYVNQVARKSFNAIIGGFIASLLGMETGPAIVHALTQKTTPKTTYYYGK